MHPWEERLARMAPTSAKIASAAARVIAGGTTHPLRELSPFPIAIERADGSRKWDADGNEYVDFVVGHGALLLGHRHPALLDALRAQVERGTHYGAVHRGEVEWAELVCDLVPSAERVRFTSSGTEAVMLAVRAARAFTGRTVVVKVNGHFHGWSELGLVGLSGPYDVLPPGLAPSASSDVSALPASEEAFEERLARGDVACVILEPSGANYGQVPLPGGFLSRMREMCDRSDVLLVFDEVVTGFRWAPGGAQELYGVAPDLSVLAKILGGGLPAGAVAGRQEVMDQFARGAGGAPATLFHPGTFNANPLSAAAGIATLREVATGEHNKRADAAAAELRSGMSDALASAGVPGDVYGDSSDFHVYLGPMPPSEGALKGMRGPVGTALRSAMLAGGADLMGPGGMLSSAHDGSDAERTVAAFADAIRELASEGVVAGA